MQSNSNSNQSAGSNQQQQPPALQQQHPPALQQQQQLPLQPLPALQPVYIVDMVPVETLTYAQLERWLLLISTR